jgi:hypothetical protein
VFTHPARRALWAGQELDSVVRPADLLECGLSPAEIRAQLAARRWQRVGRSVVLHNSTLRTEDRLQVALSNCGPRSVLTAFTAVAELGLTGWEDEAVHVLVPGGTHVRHPPGVTLRVHFTGNWAAEQRLLARPIHAAAPALLRAAATFRSPRPACGILAAGVQQQLVSAQQLTQALTSSLRIRHHAALLCAVRDIGQGADALSEIDFARLCRRYRLPLPARQAVRTEPSGRRRYLDALWVRQDGRTVAAEVDGAVHLVARRWWDDQLRQNELSLAGALVLRFPSVVVRTEPRLVADQLRRALLLPAP